RRRSIPYRSFVGTRPTHLPAARWPDQQPHHRDSGPRQQRFGSQHGGAELRQSFPQPEAGSAELPALSLSSRDHSCSGRNALRFAWIRFSICSSSSFPGALMFVGFCRLVVFFSITLGLIRVAAALPQNGGDFSTDVSGQIKIPTETILVKGAWASASNSKIP